MKKQRKENEEWLKRYSLKYNISVVAWIAVLAFVISVINFIKN